MLPAWGIRSNLSHPGITPTNLLSAQPGMGRPDDTTAVKLIRALSRRGILVGTPASGALPGRIRGDEPVRRRRASVRPEGLPAPEWAARRAAAVLAAAATRMPPAASGTLSERLIGVSIAA